VEAPEPGLEGYQRRALGSLLVVWLVVAGLAIGSALQSDWAPFGELPTPAQVDRAREAAWGAGVVSTVPPAAGLLLALRWRSAGWTAAFLVGVLLAVLVGAFLLFLTGSPVRAG
jgi:MFS family permease